MRSLRANQLLRFRSPVPPRKAWDAADRACRTVPSSHERWSREAEGICEPNLITQLETQP